MNGIARTTEKTEIVATTALMAMIVRVRSTQHIFRDTHAERFAALESPPPQHDDLDVAE